MIVFSLTCANDHVFEAWFPSGAAYQTQSDEGAIACPFCGNTAIRKAPMAPRVARHRDGKRESRDDAPTANADAVADRTPAEGDEGRPGGGLPMPPDGPAAEAWRKLAAVCRMVEANTDDVGNRFAEEARRIHYGETEPRGIRGQTSDDEAETLAEEGIGFNRLPWIPSDRH